MKCTIPEISWHNRDPVLSIDIQPKTDKNDVYRLASGGTDSHVLIWYMTPNESGSINLDLAADLTRHQRAVNAVKWSPNGELLASGDDESVIFIWKQKAESEPVNIMDDTNEQDKEIWITLKILRGHMEDVYDLSWSPNSLFLVSGSVDNSAIVWDVNKGKSLNIMNDHKGFVQGVAWDPNNQYIATLCTDRYLRFFDIQTKKVVARTSKCILSVPESHELFEKKVRIFHDDTLQTFFRRLCFSPDGKLIFTPSGVTDYDGVIKPKHTTYVFSRYNLKQPAIVLPSTDQYTVVVKCCPLLFKLRPHNEETNKPVVPLPYRMIFAVATKSSVYLYDTQQKMPFGLISNIHYTRLTDLTWSGDARILIVSSTDGFCSLITFAEGELGELYENKDGQFTEDKENNVINAVPKANTMKKEEKSAPTPIQVKRKADSGSAAKNSKEATPIQIKRKPGPAVRNETDLPSSAAPKEPVEAESEEKPKPTDVTIKPLIAEKLPADIIIDKDIISYEEKFESPEKKSRPATPIMVRRHPRTPSSQPKPLTSTTSPAIQSKSARKANPIAIRRQPRSLISTPVEKTVLVEEAMDAWPLGEPMPKATPKTETPAKQIDESTEDIRLVYEESQDEEQIAAEIESEEKTGKETEPSQTTAECKTPRRVQLKTISTPKSGKKSPTFGTSV